MKKSLAAVALLCCAMILSPSAFATNGDNLIGVGPVSRSMGGVGIASPQDPISAVFANPAAMCFGPYCPSSEFNFAGTAFAPDVKAEIRETSGITKSNSKSNIYAIPAIGISTPITEGAKPWRFGLAAYGVTGLGVDYRGKNIDDGFFEFGMGSNNPPLVSGEYTQLQIFKFAPAVSWQPLNQLSVGLAAHIDYATLDLRDGGSPGYGFGAQLGLIYKPTTNLSLGLNYITEQKVEHEKVTDFDQDGKLDDLDLSSPQQFGFGAAYTFLGGDLLLAADTKWLNWKDADGYEDFDWDDQWVFAVGTQYFATQKLVLRAGYNYGQNPVNKNNGFDGSFNLQGMPNDAVNVQGAYVPRYYYETFRIIGFPAIVEHHVSLGIGYQFTQAFSAHLGFMHAFENDFSETGTDLTGQPVTIKSTLSENSFDFGLSWRF
jgi:long-chain fatty acid transport protein